MNVLVYLVPMALALGLTGVVAFLWSLRSGQYEDMEGAALRVLDDDDIASVGRLRIETDPTDEGRGSAGRQDDSGPTKEPRQVREAYSG